MKFQVVERFDFNAKAQRCGDAKENFGNAWPGSASAPRKTAANLLKANYLSYFDKNDLTKRIDWFILCAVNANEISPKANARLNRIKIVSRVMKILFTLYLICCGPYLLFVHKMPDGFWVVAGTYATFSDVPLIAKLVVGLAAVLILAASITCYQLLNLYEKGIIFSARNVRLPGRIGCLALSYKLLGITGPLMIQAWNGWIGASTFHFHLNVIWLDLCEFMVSPLVIGGFFLIVISRIMDEGRKIQEEQELTV